MTTHNTKDLRHGWGSIRHLTPARPAIVLVLERMSGLSSWFRSFRSAARQPGLREAAPWFLGTLRLQPILVAATARHAVASPRSRGHFNRI